MKNEASFLSRNPYHEALLRPHEIILMQGSRSLVKRATAH